MFFKKNNIDEEFIDNNIFSFFKKYKIYIIIGLLLVLLLGLLFFNKDISVNSDNNIYLNLFGDKEVTIYVGEDYIEPGYYAGDSLDNDLTREVSVTTDLDIYNVGKYKITYKFRDIVKERYINIIENNHDNISIVLNGDTDMYLLVGEDYIEPGYMVNSSLNNISNDQVIVAGKVDTSLAGEYKLIYSVKDLNGVEINSFRNVIVMDLNLSFEYDKEYTNGDVQIKYSLNNKYLDYIMLPNNNKVNDNVGTYGVNSNGEYKFIVYGLGGKYKENKITINNIDKVLPTGSCSIEKQGSNTILSIESYDNVGIDRYIYNDKVYTDSKIMISSNIKSSKVRIYDVSGNNMEIDCHVVPSVYINSLKKDGAIVTVNASEFVNKVSGYYFSYNKTRPNKNSGGYVAADKTSIDVVRLPGTTYIWVEDNKGNISDYKAINVSNNDVIITTGTDYKLLQNKRLDEFLISKNSSIDELNTLISRSVRAAGLYTKEAVATSAMSLQLVLAQKYKIRIPYFNGGKSYGLGAEGKWGAYKYGVDEYRDKEYFYDGLDCMGFVTWAYVNAGYDIINSDNKYGGYFDSWWFKRVDFENGEIGDVLVNNDSRDVRHVKLIIGKTKDAYITAEATSMYDGMVIRTHSFNKPDNYKVEKAELIMNDYNKISKTKYPSGN